jgi:hypothetical protein
MNNMLDEQIALINCNQKIQDDLNNGMLKNLDYEEAKYIKIKSNSTHRRNFDQKHKWSVDEELEHIKQTRKYRIDRYNIFKMASDKIEAELKNMKNEF